MSLSVDFASIARLAHIRAGEDFSELWPSVPRILMIALYNTLDREKYKFLTYADELCNFYTEGKVEEFAEMLNDYSNKSREEIKIIVNRFWPLAGDDVVAEVLLSLIKGYEIIEIYENISIPYYAEYKQCIGTLKQLEYRPKDEEKYKRIVKDLNEYILPKLYMDIGIRGNKVMLSDRELSIKRPLERDDRPAKTTRTE
jgi:hypothetical protein